MAGRAADRSPARDRGRMAVSPGDPSHRECFARANHSPASGVLRLRVLLQPLRAYSPGSWAHPEVGPWTLAVPAPDSLVVSTAGDETGPPGRPDANDESLWGSDSHGGASSVTPRTTSRRRDEMRHRRNAGSDDSQRRHGDRDQDLLKWGDVGGSSRRSGPFVNRKNDAANELILSGFSRGANCVIRARECPYSHRLRMKIRAPRSGSGRTATATRGPSPAPRLRWTRGCCDPSRRHAAVGPTTSACGTRRSLRRG